MTDALRDLGDTLHRHDVVTADVVVGDMRQVGRYISPVETIEPYICSITGDLHLTLNGINPPHPVDEQMVVWRNA